MCSMEKQLKLLLKSFPAGIQTWSDIVEDEIISNVPDCPGDMNNNIHCEGQMQAIAQFRDLCLNIIVHQRPSWADIFPAALSKPAVKEEMIPSFQNKIILHDTSIILQKKALPPQKTSGVQSAHYKKPEKKTCA